MAALQLLYKSMSVARVDGVVQVDSHGLSGEFTFDPDPRAAEELQFGSGSWSEAHAVPSGEEPELEARRAVLVRFGEDESPIALQAGPDVVREVVYAENVALESIFNVVNSVHVETREIDPA